MKRIATHRKPDADALVSAWLVRRFAFEGQDAVVDFVDRSFHDTEREEHHAVVDVGCRYDPCELRFDHKPPAVRDRHSTCASRMVWELLLADGWDLSHLAGLIDAVHDGDSVKRRGGSLAYKSSRRDGLHARIVEIQKTCPDDRDVFSRTEAWLVVPA